MEENRPERDDSRASSANHRSSHTATRWRRRQVPSRALIWGIPSPAGVRFTELPIHAETQLALEAMGFEETTPVQEQTIPPLLAGRDLIAQAQTGTGKTAAFGIPLVDSARAGKRGIVLTPTRELAKQVQRELQAIAHGSRVDVVCLIGGAPFGEQARALKRHPEAVLVATPGRVVDHLTRGTLDLSKMRILVLDEA